MKENNLNSPSLLKDSLDDYLKRVVCEKISSHLLNMPLPDQQIPKIDIFLNLGQEAYNYTCSLAGGYIQAAGTQLVEFHQECQTTFKRGFKEYECHDTDPYKVQLQMALTVLYKKWDEHYDYYVEGGPHVPAKLEHVDQQCGVFTVKIQQLDVSFNLTTTPIVSVTDIQVTHPATVKDKNGKDENNIQFTLPSSPATVLSGNMKCIQDRIDEGIRQHIGSIDFKTPIEAEIKKFLKS